MENIYMAKKRKTPEPAQNGALSLQRPLLMVGGLLLTLLSQHLMQLSPHKLINLVLLLLGAAAFLFGMMFSTPGRTTRFLQAGVEKIARFLNVSEIQVLLILFGLSLSLASRSAAGNSLTAHSPLYGLIWIGGFLLVIMGCWRRPSKDSPSTLDRWDWITLGILLIVSLATRVVYLNEIPVTVSGDEGSVGMMAWDYKTGVRNNLLIMGWFSFPALQFMPASLFQGILGQSVVAMRLPSAIGGALAVLATYWAVRQMFGRIPGILAGLFLSAFHYHLLFSRISLANIWDGFFLMAMIAGLWIAWKDNERYAFLVAGAAIGLGQYFYTTSHLLPIYAILWLLILRKSRPAEGRLPGLVSLTLVLLAFVLPLTLFYVENPNELMAPLSRVSILKADWIRGATQSTGKHAIVIFAELFWKTILGFTASPMNGVYSPGTPMLLTIPATLFLAGLLITVIRIKDPRYNILLIGLLGPLFASTFSVEPPNAQRLLFTAPLVSALIILPINEIWSQLVAAKPQFRSALTTAVIALMVVIGFLEVKFFLNAMAEGRYSDRKSFVARRVAGFLHDQGDDIQVYFFGQPVMDYHTLPSLPYIAHNATGHDMRLPLDSDQNPPIEGENIAIVLLPQNFEVLSEVERQFPQGKTITEHDDKGDIIFIVRLVQP
jgi:4-amino-4-deoxy-L-arabinose transferase-like glycosyltransferase